jgi:hypothetical protein
LSLIPRRLARNGDISTVAPEAADVLVNRAAALQRIALADAPAWPYHAFRFYHRGNAMASWGCPHEINGICTKINDLNCDPGMKGCVLAGRYFFLSSDDKNERRREKQERSTPENDNEPPA